MELLHLFQRLGLALALGLLIGLERGWQLRERSEGARLAGLRTFGLTGLMGGVWALLARDFGPAVLGVGFAALAVVVILAHLQMVRGGDQPDHGITTVVALLLTFAFGALTVSGSMAVAAAGAVITAFLLGLKPVLHDWLRRLTEPELFAALKLLLISVVILPVLPNRGLGPWGALNPYALWWMVVLIAGISFVGYFAVKLMGPNRGVPLTGLAGGLASSTATTLSFSRLGRRQPDLRRLLAAGVALSAATMFPRIALEAAVVNSDVLPVLGPVMATMTALGFLAAGLLWWKAGNGDTPGEVALQNPFEIGPALQFGFLLATIMLLAEGARAWLGDAGVYLLAGVSGLTDVDAITLSLSRMAQGELSTHVAARAITLAAMVNTVVKGGLVVGIAGRGMAGPVAAAFGVVLAGGMAAVLLL
ncbi:MgtC/SapB family protein [Thiohalorhabdus methylotrophus]|uniref:MgtC/SapB family protein n=1 Tax=Thiohalorhabdus methylotrophus TaxID=3242694 RepID=A0ABV4TT61_9GAMM